MGKAGVWVVRVPRAEQDPAARAQIDTELRALDEDLRMLGATIRVGNVSAGEAWAGKGVGIEALRAIGPATRDRIQELKGLQELVRGEREKRQKDRDGGRGPRPRSEDDLNRDIERLQGKMAAGGLSLSQEKAAVKDLSVLQQQIKALRVSGAGEPAASPKASPKAGAPAAAVQEAKKNMDWLRQELDILRARESFYKSHMGKHDAQQKEVRDGISGVVKERDELRKKRDATYKKLQELNKFNSAEEKTAFQCRKSARAVRDLVEKGDFEAAQEAANAQVEKWMSECWNSAEYRKEYVKLHSQRSRQRFRGEVEAEVDKELGIEGFTSGSSGPIMTDKVKESIKSKAKREVDALLAQAARGAKSNA